MTPYDDNPPQNRTSDSFDDARARQKKTVDEFLNEMERPAYEKRPADPWTAINAKVNDDSALDCDVEQAPRDQRRRPPLRSSFVERDDAFDARRAATRDSFRADRDWNPAPPRRDRRVDERRPNPRYNDRRAQDPRRFDRSFGESRAQGDFQNARRPRNDAPRYASPRLNDREDRRRAPRIFDREYPERPASYSQNFKDAKYPRASKFADSLKDRRRSTQGGRPPRTRDARPERRDPVFGERSRPRDLRSIAEDIAAKRQRAGRTDEELAPEIAKLAEMDASALVAELRANNCAEPTNNDRIETIMLALRARIERNGLMFGVGTLEILPGGFGFLRSKEARYRSTPDDVYVSPSQINLFELRTGSEVSGQIRPPKENEKYFALLRVESVNGREPIPDEQSLFFEELVAARVNAPLKLELDADADSNDVLATRAIDLFAPIGLGQRALVLARDPASADRALSAIVRGARQNRPEAVVFILALGKSEDELAALEALESGSLCETFGATREDASERVMQVAEIAVQKALRNVECGRDVVLVVDSFEKFADALKQSLPAADRDLQLVGSETIQRAKKLFTLARAIENGGSLTVVGSVERREEASNDGFGEKTVDEFEALADVVVALDDDGQVDFNRSVSRDARHFLDAKDADRRDSARRALRKDGKFAAKLRDALASAPSALDALDAAASK